MRIEDKRLKAAFWTMCTLLVLELIAIMALIHFAKIVFFVALVIAVIRSLSYFLIGLVAIFLIFSIFGIRAGAIIEWWKKHILEYSSTVGGATVLTVLSIGCCIGIGALIRFSLAQIFSAGFMASVRGWVALHIQ